MGQKGNKRKAYRKWKRHVKAKKRREKRKRHHDNYIPSKSNLKHGPVISHFLQNKTSFIGKEDTPPKDGIFKIPKHFSLTENADESYGFITQLFLSLRNQNFKNIKLDYSDCQKIDLDASICMDIILKEFIAYFKRSKRNHINIKIKTIKAINLNSDKIKKFMFSTGSHKTLNGLDIQYDDIITYNLCVGGKFKKESKIKNQSRKEVDVTELIDYIIDCLKRMKKTLSPSAISNYATIIGEILTNTEDHSTVPYRYSVGYFQDIADSNKHIGVFNLVIFNFGKSIYEILKDPKLNLNKNILYPMKELSKKYTKNKLFLSSEFEEETLWTLYSLQEGVSSISTKRGNGTIRFIESFFNLTDQKIKNNSHLTLLSGNTKIVFDGSYEIKNVQKGKNNFKMMTFNKSGKIEEKPDKKFVKFTKNYFPGTMLVAKIFITENTLSN